MSLRVVGRFLQGTAKSYVDWLEEKGYKLTSEQFADHKNFLETITPALKALKLVLNRYEFQGGSWEKGAKFSREELHTLVEAKNILTRAEFPLAGLTVEEKKPKILKIPR